MGRTITALFEDGVLKPVTPLGLPSNTLVRITIESREESAEARQQAWQALERCGDEFEVDSGGVLPTRDESHDWHQYTFNPLIGPQIRSSISTGIRSDRVMT